MPTDGRPAPLVPAEVDLRDFAFMPLDVVRLRDSGLTASRQRRRVPGGRAAVVRVLASAAGRKPAERRRGTANLCGYPGPCASGPRSSVAPCAAGSRQRRQAVPPDGGCQKPMTMEPKLAQRARTEAARRAREAKRQTQPQGLSQTAEKSVTEDVTASKGQGQGQGYSVPEGTDAVPASPARRPPRKTASSPSACPC